jgi:hypothetical protein
MQQPIAIELVAYQVGFGDCFLLRFEYTDGWRHVLIDCGTTGMPESAERDQMLRIAQDIRDTCGGRLDLVVATHRHADHISGFATKDGEGSGDILAALATSAILLQPWTEDPAAAVDATGPLPDDRQGFDNRRKSLKAMQEISAAVVARLRPVAGREVPQALKDRADQLGFIGSDNMSNLSAVTNLMHMGKERIYAYHGLDVDLSAVLPGVKLHILGPPTVKQSAAIRSQRQRDPDEFWMKFNAMLGVAPDGRPFVDGPALFPDHPTQPYYQLPIKTRWFANRVEQADADQLLSMVRALDKAMNNTSLILLFEAGGKKLLFPGDAQIENWQFALERKDIRTLLADVDLYKVGHHGSLNATPKTLWKMFKRKGKHNKRDRMASVMSTMDHKHGHVETSTEVPRSTLVAALKSGSDLHDTRDCPPDALHLRPMRWELA